MTAPLAVPSEEVSVVIQGPLREGVDECVASVQRHLPDAQVILSTWTTEDASRFGHLDLVQSPCPEGFLGSDGVPNNVNRMVASTQAGLRVARHPFVLKFRTDCRLTGTAMTTLAPSLEAGPTTQHLFADRLTVVYLLDPTFFPLLFHPGDQAQFGRKADMVDYWGNDLFEHDDLYGKSHHSWLRGWNYGNRKESPEQSLCLDWLERHGVHVDLAHPADVSRALVRQWEGIALANFWVPDDPMVQFPARMPLPVDFGYWDDAAAGRPFGKRYRRILRTLYPLSRRGLEAYGGAMVANLSQGKRRAFKATFETVFGPPP